MRNHILLIASLLIIFCGCDREEPLPELGVEGVYLMARMVDGVIVEGSDLPYENVYWFFVDRTFRKARLEDGVLTESSGTFFAIPNPEVGGMGQAFELNFTEGEFLIEGCHDGKEILIQTTDTELLHLGSPCGEPDIYYIKANLGGE